MRRTLPTIALAALTALAAGPAIAYVTFSGVDDNILGVRLTSTPNASAADSSFRALISSAGTETFENKTPGTPAPLELDFGSAGTATLIGGGGRVEATSNLTIAAGRYSVPGGTNYWDVTASAANSFRIDFSQEIAAFGFYGIDIGDFAGTLQLELVNSASQVIASLNVPTAIRSRANASVLYFGVIASNSSEMFRSIRFNTIGGGGASDIFGFDSFTIGSRAPVTPPLPEPGSLALVGAALLGLSLLQRRRS